MIGLQNMGCPILKNVNKLSQHLVLLFLFLQLVHHHHHRPPVLASAQQLDMMHDQSSAAAAACNASGRCANLGDSNIYPFASNPACAASASTSRWSSYFYLSNWSSYFYLSKCSSEQAYWDAFTNAITHDYGASQNIGPPAVMGISWVNYSAYIDLTWDSDLISQPNKQYSTSAACSTPPVPLANLSHTIPPSIDLSPLIPDYDSDYYYYPIRISKNNVYLLFNCAQPQTSLPVQGQTVKANTALCQSYRSQCSTLVGPEYYTFPCVQLSFDDNPKYTDIEGSSNKFSLQRAMNNLGCTHFQFFVTESTGADDTSVTEWGRAILQLRWTDPVCLRGCVEYGGSCVLDSTNHTFEKCTNCSYWSADVDADGLCSFPDSCTGARFSICHLRTKIVVSVVVVVLVGTALILICYCRRRRSRSMKPIEKQTEFPRKTRAPWPAARAHEFSSGSNESLNEFDLNGLSERPMEYSYSSIASATSSFSSKVGEGGFGVVFKGALDVELYGAAGQLGGGVQKQEIAVKVLEVRSKHSRKQFLNEVAIIGRIHHVNVVRLLGFCVERLQEERIHEMLVYEYVVNGSLDTWLFTSPAGERAAPAGGAADHPEKDQELRLEWGQRYGIALGVARGLCYLHEECRHRIVHCDIKPQNILLDATMCPKIADFGLARLMSRDESRVVTLAKGTPGYMAPEFWVGGDIHLSTKADVYSYGMVLLELVSGRRNFAFGCPRFPALAFEAAMRSDFESILDAHLLQVAVTPSSSEEHSPFLMWQQVRTTVFVALWCIQEHPASRPCMSEVVQYLEGIAAVSEQPPLPAIASTSPLPPANIIALESNSHLQGQTPISKGR